MLRALNQADPLPLNQIYVVVDRDLAARNLPRPQRRVVNTAGDLVLSRGPSRRSHTERTDSDAARFTRTYRSLIEAGLRVRRTAFASIPLLGLAFPFLGSPVSFLTIIQSTIGGLILVPLSITLLGISKSRDTRVEELIVDRSDLTIIRRNRARTHLPWRDIAQIGVLQPERGALSHRLPAAQYTRTDALVVRLRPEVLVVRLRPEVPAPDVVSVLSEEHRQLGYLGLCTVEEFGSSRQEMISALERFAGGKLVHSSRQFLDRDPRLRPEMV